MRVIDADLFIRWTERDADGNEIECCGTVEDLMCAVGAAGRQSPPKNSERR